MGTLRHATSGTIAQWDGEELHPGCGGTCAAGEVPSKSRGRKGGLKQVNGRGGAGFTPHFPAR